jgi:dolichol kinase
MAHLSGLITVGVGDTFASIIGSNFGNHKLMSKYLNNLICFFFFSKRVFKLLYIYNWGSSNKSIEGTLAMLISQFGVFVLLHFLGLINLIDSGNILFVMIAVTLSSGMEAFTVDNDNLLLPIIVYPFLILVE